MNVATRTGDPFVFYLNNGCNQFWIKVMGYTGECVQHESIANALALVRFSVHGLTASF